MSIQYPEISLVTQGVCTSTKSAIDGNRVSIEQNPKIKFLMLFALLDFHVDTIYPDMEGKCYRDKYTNFPVQGDFNLILRQLFRVAKVIRNALVHNQSAFCIVDGYVNVECNYGKKSFSLNISMKAFNLFCSVIVMYIRGDMGKGKYFLGIVRSIYGDILAGIKKFNDEFGNKLEQSSGDIRMKPYNRRIFLSEPYEVSGGVLRFVGVERKLPAWEGMDFYIVHNDEEFLIPREALGEDLSIAECDLIADWKREGRFPPVKAP